MLASDFLALARQRLLAVPPQVPHPSGSRSGHVALATHAAPAGHGAPGPRPWRPAAVLVPVVDRPEGATLLLTCRSTSLRDHSGQIAFPGGKVDEADGGPLGAALREAEEEIGLDPRLVHPAGYLDLYLTHTGFRITPVVARIEPDFRLVLNPSEVDDAFEVPLAFLMDAANHQVEHRAAERLSSGVRPERVVYAMPHGARYIWGITAGIVRSLYERVMLDEPVTPDEPVMPDEGGRLGEPVMEVR